MRVGKPRKAKGKSVARLSGASKNDATRGITTRRHRKKSEHRKRTTRTPLHKAIASLDNLTPTARRRITEARAESVDSDDLVMFCQAQTELAIQFYNSDELTAKELMVSLRWIGGMLQAAVQLSNEAGSVAPSAINVSFNLQSEHIPAPRKRSIVHTDGVKIIDAEPLPPLVEGDDAGDAVDNGDMMVIE